MKLEVSLRKRHGDFALAADFTVEGDRLGLFGPSGSGKSTLMSLLAGLLKPDAGFIRLDGQVLCDVRQGRWTPPEKRRIAVVFQHGHLFPHLSAGRNLLYGYQRLARSERKIDPDALCAVLQLEPLLGRAVAELSGGERRRVALGRAVLACPRLLLMDEPLTGLDAGLKGRIIPYLKQVFAEFAIPVLFSSHSLNEMRLMTEQVLELGEGRLLGLSSVEALARRRLASSRVGYINLMELADGRPRDGLWDYRWGGRRLILASGDGRDGLFELSSKDVTLFKRHPEAASARNILPCRVGGLFEAGNRVGVELDCDGVRLVSQVVGEAARELDIAVGAPVYAIIKASAFRPLY